MNIRTVVSVTAGSVVFQKKLRVVEVACRSYSPRCSPWARRVSARVGVVGNSSCWFRVLGIPSTRAHQVPVESGEDAAEAMQVWRLTSQSPVLAMRIVKFTDSVPTDAMHFTEQNFSGFIRAGRPARAALCAYLYSLSVSNEQPDKPGMLAVPVNHSDHFTGSHPAAVTVVDYGNFECPSCGQTFPAVRMMLRHFGAIIRFGFRHFPQREVRPHAELAAEAAGAQHKFWPMHDLLFENQRHLKAASLRNTPP